MSRTSLEDAEKKQLATKEENELRQFELNLRCGPFLGMTQLQRW